MKRLLLLLTVAMSASVLFAQSKAAGVLKIYKAKEYVVAKCYDCEPGDNFSEKYKQNQFIADSQCEGGEMGPSAEFSNKKCMICLGDGCYTVYMPDYKVKTERYEMGEVTVDMIGDGIQFDAGDVHYEMFIGHRNGHKFTPMFFSDYYLGYPRLSHRDPDTFCVLTANRNDGWCPTEYIIPIADNHLVLYNNGRCIVHTDRYQNINPDYADDADYENMKPSFDKAGNLITDMYAIDGKPSWFGSFCYIPLLNKFYVGYGHFASYRPLRR